MQGFLTPWRIQWYSGALLLALALGFLIAVLGGQGTSTLTGRLGGDYPAFYGAGRIIAEGDGANLYSPARQHAIQEGLFPREQSSFLAFSYPPFVALAYYPLSLFSFKVSYIVHTLLMVGALIWALQLLRPVNPLIDRYPLPALALALSFYPLFRAITGGQNTALTLLLLVSGWRLLLAGREWPAGIILGLLLFKPQFALPLLGLLVLSGRWRVGLGGLLTGMMLYLLGAWVSGPRWPLAWSGFAWWFTQTDVVVNCANSVSWLGFFQALAGFERPLALILGYGAIALTIAGCVLVWMSGGRRGDLTAQWGLTMPALVLIPFHVMYYDVSLVLFTYAAMIAAHYAKIWPLIGVAWLVGFSQMLNTVLGFSPLFLVLVGTGIFAVDSLGRLALNRGVKTVS
jgi:hypothetical protein